jgi:DNA repair protein RecO (recombination protein O)
MSSELKYTAIILKKQPFNEGDEIITFYTKENGKVRGLAKSSKSKLQQKLQTLFLVQIILAGGKLPKIISVEAVEVFLLLRENLTAMKIAFYAIEVVLKSSADEEKNELLFNLLYNLLSFLNINSDEAVLELGLAKFKIDALEALGLGIQKIEALGNQNLFFSPIRGGFFKDRTADAISVKQSAVELFEQLQENSFDNLSSIKMAEDLSALQELLSNFIGYQLERKLKSETYLKM